MRVGLMFLWFFLAINFAHAQTLAQGLSSISMGNTLIAACLAFVGGAAWTAQKEARRETENKKLWATVFSDILVSVVAGLITYFLLSIATDSPLVQAALITIAGYGGTRIMDGYVSSLLDRIKGKSA